MPSEIHTDSPNILLLFVDQLRFDAMGCAGNEHIQTPNLDRMAREGLRFTRAYTPVPVSIAARHSLLHGHRCATHGRFGNNVPIPEPRLYTLPQLLAESGYHTRAIGKMHWRPVRRHFGFSRMELMEEIPDHRQDDEYLMYLEKNGCGHVREVHGVRNLLYKQPQVSVIPEEHHGSTWVADRTVEFIRTNTHRPFFCWSSWIAPHPPWNAPEPFASMYDEDSLPLPVGWDRPLESLPSMLRGNRYGGMLADASPERLRRIKALYYGNVSLIDKGVGRILRAVDEMGIAGRTLVIFTSDHGELLGDQGCWQKSNPYEPSAHVPFIMRMPGTVDAGTTSDDIVSLLDIMPTALDLAGRDYPGEPRLPGASLMGKKGGGLAEPRDELVVEIGRGDSRWLSLLRGPWKYTYYVRDGWKELYNIEEDPDELDNRLLADASSDEQARADEMHAVLTEWEKEHGFDDSLDENGSLKNLGKTVKNPQEYARRSNSQFPRWVDRLPSDEKALMEPPGAPVYNASKFEDTFEIKSLPHYAHWREIGGSHEGTPLDEDP